MGRSIEYNGVTNGKVFRGGRPKKERVKKRSDKRKTRMIKERGN